MLGDNDIKGRLSGFLGFLFFLVNAGIPGWKKSWKAMISFHTVELYMFRDDVQPVRTESTRPVFALC